MRLVFSKENIDIFEMVESGKKRVETRAATKKYQSIQKGDTLEFVCDTSSFSREVKVVYIYPSIDLLLEKYTPEEINPKLSTKEEIVAMYHSFPGYEEKIKEHGIIAIELI